MAHIRLGELLVRAGHLSEAGLASALEEQKKWGGRLGRILREMNLVSEEVLLVALSKQLGLPRADLSQPSIPPDILASIDPRFALENRLCPESYDIGARTLLVAMEDHLNLAALDQIRAKLGVRVKTSLAAVAEINAALAALYPSDPIATPPDPDRGAIFETKDFSNAAADARAEDEPKSSVRMMESADFAEAASQVRESSTGLRSPGGRLLSTDDFTEDADKVRDDSE